MFKSEEIFVEHMQNMGFSLSYIPVKFDLSTGTYRPDFYCPEDGTFYEVANGNSSLNKKRDKIDLLEKEYPHIKFKVVTPRGREIPKIDGRYFLAKLRTLNPPLTTAFALPSSLMDKITDEAKKDDRTPSYIIRKIVRDYFEGK